MRSKILKQGIDALAGIKADLCVVGSGPIGLSIAKDLAGRGRAVVLLESGGIKPGGSNSGLSEAKIISRNRHAPMASVACRALGGASWLWGGRCVPFDPVDFSKRPYIIGSEWPIEYSDIADYYSSAAEFLCCGSGNFRLPNEETSDFGHLISAGIHLDSLERWCGEPVLAVRLKNEPWPPGLTVVTDATVVDLEVVDGAVQAVIVAEGERRLRFDGSKYFVLACGGLETTRLLLVLQTRYPNLFGGETGALGRYYMGHLSGHHVEIRFDHPGNARHFVYRDEGSVVSRARIAISGDMQQKHFLPNVVFWPANPDMGNPAHGSGLLSLLFLLLSTPGLGSRFISEPIRQMQLRVQPNYPGHVKNILRDLPVTAVHALDLLWQKYGKRRRKPFFFLNAADGGYLLHYHGEHRPNRESRIFLTAEKNAIGVPLLGIDLRFTHEDALGIARAHLFLDRALRKCQVGRLLMHGEDLDLDRLSSTILEHASDGFSQIGLTRMGTGPSDAVVDSNCKAFDVSNLFVAGSSVFRTSGHANPVLPAVALALRLSSHLDRLLTLGRTVA